MKFSKHVYPTYQGENSAVKGQSASPIPIFAAAPASIPRSLAVISFLSLVGCARHEPSTEPTASPTPPVASQIAARPVAAPTLAPVVTIATVGADEIRLDGRLQKVDVQRGEATLVVASFTLPNGRIRRLSKVKPKVLNFNGDTLVLRLTSPEVLPLTVLGRGAMVGVIGKDAGAGQMLAARYVEIRKDAPGGGTRVASRSVLEPAVPTQTTGQRRQRRGTSEGSPQNPTSRADSNLKFTVYGDVHNLADQTRGASSTETLFALEKMARDLEAIYMARGDMDAVAAVVELKNGIREKRFGPNAAGITMWEMRLNNAESLALKAARRAQMTPEQKKQSADDFVRRMEEFEKRSNWRSEPRSVR